MNYRLFVIVCGIGHAFQRMLGCKCERCNAVNFNMTEPPKRLQQFNGWDDPVWRACTAASLALADQDGRIIKHLLFDAGPGVAECLAALQIPGIENIEAIAISHRDSDHASSSTVNLITESLSRLKTSIL